jgi:hypothetical protein
VVSSNALPQTQCPHCKAAVTYFAPGCFNCRQSIQWPPPANQQQFAIQQAATAQFNEMFARYQQQQAPQPPQPAAVVQAPRVVAPAAAPVAAVSSSSSALPGGDLEGLLEVTRHDSVAYNPDTAEDVDGLMPQSYAEFVPAQVTVETLPEFSPTAAQAEGPGLGITAMPNSELEMTHFATAGELAAPPVEDFDNARFTELTAQIPTNVVPDVELERTAISDENRPTRRRKAAVAEGKRICKDCGTVSDKTSCPACGAATKDLAA